MIAAFCLVLIAGLMQGSFVVPMKIMRKWEWENIWLVFCLLGFVVIPYGLARATIPGMWHVFGAIPSSTLITILLLGFGWGIGSICFGLGVRMLGVGLGLSIILGLTSSVGALIPWITLSAEVPVQKSVLLLVGVSVMLVGVVICSFSGRERERAQEAGSGVNNRFLVSLAVAVASGILSSFLNVAFAEGDILIRKAQAFGATANNAPNILWLTIMSAGFAANCCYCGYLLLKRGTWRLFFEHAAPNWGWALLMAIGWCGSLVAYGIGVGRLGTLGVSLGWAVLMAVTIIMSNGWGVILGEWRKAGVKATRIMSSGLVVLLIAVGVLALAAWR